MLHGCTQPVGGYADFGNRPSISTCVYLQAPTFKWGISIANIADFKRPPEQVSYPQQLAVTTTGVIWTRFATVIDPVRAFVMAAPRNRQHAQCL